MNITKKLIKSQKHPEYQYLDLLNDALCSGFEKKVFFTKEVLRAYKLRGIVPPSIRSITGCKLRFDVGKNFPLLTTKRVFWKGIVHELLWNLRGETNIKYLVDNNVNIWNAWVYKAYYKQNLESKHRALSEKEFIERIKTYAIDSEFVRKYGDLKITYGSLWRNWKTCDGGGIDQLSWVIDNLKSQPYRKSYVISAWNPAYIYGMASPRENASEVPPACATLFQFIVSKENKLNLVLFQRSADLFLGIPFDIASYSLLLKMVAQVTNFEVGEFIHFIGDAHIYSNHLVQVRKQLKRRPYPFPRVSLNSRVTSIDNFKVSDIVLDDYLCHGIIKGEIANVGGYEKS